MLPQHTMVKMKTLAFVAFCVILTQCHCQESAPRSRSKRTLRMLESLIGSMRDTFAPLTAPPAPAGPPEVILATKYPVGIKYALYPTVRMHIRPIQQHVIYMQSIPTLPAMPPAPVLRPARPLNTGQVEILRPMAPMMRLPKTKTTTTIHYEIIPLPVPVHSAPVPPSSPPQQQHSPSSHSSYEPPSYDPPSYDQPSYSPPSYDEGEEPLAPWSLDELPPPVPTSAPLNPVDEPNVPWNLHALPPPVATKQPKGNEVLGWPVRQVTHQNYGHNYLLPVFNKKLVIPAQSIGLHNRHSAIFRPSQLQSEITVQPSVEVAAYSEIQTLAQEPKEYVKRLHNLNNPKPQVFPNHNNRLRRDTSSRSHRYSIDNNHRLISISPNEQAAEARILSNVFTAEKFETPVDHDLMEPDLSGISVSEPFRKPATVKSYFDPKGSTSNRKQFHVGLNYNQASFGEGDSSGEYNSPRHFLQNSTRDIRISPLLSDNPPEHYVLITPRPVNYTRRLSPADPAKTETQQVKGYSKMPQPDPPNLNLFQAAGYEDKRPPQQREISNFFEQSKGSLRFPPTGLLSKSPRRPENQRSLFANKKTPLSVDHFFSEKPATDFKLGGKGHDVDDFLRSDYDKVEYFEPIIIDIDEEEKPKDNFGPKVKFKFKNFELKKSTREPLRLPDRLHDTIDHLREALMHPPIFDMESEGNEPEAVFVVVGNEIT